MITRFVRRELAANMRDKDHFIGTGSMPVFDCHGDLKGNMVDCWFPAYLNHRWAALSPADQQAITTYIDDIFTKAARTPPHRFNVTDSVPSDWNGTALQPLYDVAAGQDFEDAAKLVGNVFCRVGVRRSELWYCFQQRVGDHTSRTYMKVMAPTGGI